MPFCVLGGWVGINITALSCKHGNYPPQRTSKLTNHLNSGRNSVADESPTLDPSRVSRTRCAKLIVVAMANRLDEVWISNHPILLFVFVSQYAPTFARW